MWRLGQAKRRKSKARKENHHHATGGGFGLLKRCFLRKSKAPYAELQEITHSADETPLREEACSEQLTMVLHSEGAQPFDSVVDDGPPCFPGFDPMAPEASRRGREVPSVSAVKRNAAI